MSKFTSLVVATALALGAAGLVHAAADKLSTVAASEKPVTHKGGLNGWGMFKNLNLTDAQKTQMETIMQELRKDMPRSSLEERRAMYNITTSDHFDRAKAEALAEETLKRNKIRILKSMETQNRLYNLLTPEQKKQYNSDFAKHLTDKPRRHSPAAPATGS